MHHPTLTTSFFPVTKRSPPCSRRHPRLPFTLSLEVAERSGVGLRQRFSSFPSVTWKSRPDSGGDRTEIRFASPQPLLTAVGSTSVGRSVGCCTEAMDSSGSVALARCAEKAVTQLSNFAAGMQSANIKTESDTETSPLFRTDGSIVDVEKAGSSEKEEHQPTTNCETMMHLLKGNIGTGVLAMPSAFTNAGIAVGSIGVVLMGLICVHCMHVMVKCNRILCDKLGYKSLDFAGVAENAFKLGPQRYRRFSYAARMVVNVFLLLTQFGFCCVYFVFVAASIQEVLKGMGMSGVVVNIYFCLGVTLPFMILYNFIRSLRTLANASTLANVLQITGMALIFYNLLQDMPSISERPASASLTQLPLYFGTAIYAFEGIGLVLPLENEMKTPRDFGGLTGVLNTGMMIVVCLYTGMGFFGYLKYGDEVRGSITLNFPPTPLNEVLRIAFTVAIFLSYALQMYVPIQITWPSIAEKLGLNEGRHSDRTVLVAEYGLRTLYVLITFALAALIPQLDLFISLVGALASSSLALILPPIIELLTLYDADCSRATWVFLCIKNFTISFFGVTGFLSGTYASLSKIIHCFSNTCPT